MEILGISPEEQLLIKYYVINHLIFAKNSKWDEYQSSFASMVGKGFDKKSSGENT